MVLEGERKRGNIVTTKGILAIISHGDTSTRFGGGHSVPSCPLYTFVFTIPMISSFLYIRTKLPLSRRIRGIRVFLDSNHFLFSLSTFVPTNLSTTEKRKSNYLPYLLYWTKRHNVDEEKKNKKKQGNDARTSAHTYNGHNTGLFPLTILRRIIDLVRRAALGVTDKVDAQFLTIV